jgi:nucleotide sugar dehydrogenase
MKIAIIGYGYVGKACYKAFGIIENSFMVIDPKENNNTIADLAAFDPELTFVCVPAPTLDDGTVDTSIIHGIFVELSKISYKGLVVLKSTVPPTQIGDLCDEKLGLRYVYSPEFLRESSWEEDAVNPNLIIIGARRTQERTDLLEYYKEFSRINKTNTRFVNVQLEEASFMKYTINTFLALKVVYFNQLHSLYKDMFSDTMKGDSWKWFTEAIQLDPRMGHSHMKVPGPDGQFGYGGTCFPKDVKAFLGTDKNERMTVLKEAEVANTKIRIAKN